MHRIGLDATFLRQPATGSGQYTQNLALAIARLDKDRQYFLLGRDFAPLEGSPSEIALSWTQVGARGIGGSLPGDLAKVWWEQATLSRLSRQLHLDLLHCPYFAGPVLSPCGMVVTIHDIIPFLMPAYRGPWWAMFYWSLVRAAARRADMVITDSRASQVDISRKLRIDPARIAVTPLGVSDWLRLPLSAEKKAALMSRFAISGPFILYVGGLDVRKNVKRLLRAYASASRGRSGFPMLVIVGKPHSDNTRVFPDLAAVIGELRLSDAVVFTGPVTDEEKAALYQAADLFVFPSLYEGFGLPPLEAMASGTPVLASNSSSLPEVVGDAGMLVEPTDTDAMASAMAKIVYDDGLREELRQRGLERAREFSWERTARQTIDIYRSILSGRRGA
ncbi:MAG: glycosyltransferase family 4 protein [Chloroflexi bacterium]|nr:glycosyltransferase family 4 protein [Chloroflexota bacterium]